jgi:undecaprenyl-diphosphatase
MTVSAGIISGLEAEKAFKFSFLMAIPIILAAFGYKALKVDMAAEIGGNLAGYAAGGAAALIVGLASLAILDRVIKSRKLFIFGIYCLLLGIVGILFL